MPTHGTPPLREGLTVWAHSGVFSPQVNRPYWHNKQPCRSPGQNIANVNTPGYSRERAEFVSAPTSLTTILRSGVHVDEVTRAYDRFITTQVNVASSNFKSTRTQSDLLGQIEALFNDLSTPETGISGALEALFKGFHNLAQIRRGWQSGTPRSRDRLWRLPSSWPDGLQTVRQQSNGALGDASLMSTVDHTIGQSSMGRSSSGRWIPRTPPTPCVISRTCS